MVDEVGSTEAEPKYGTGLDQGAQEAADVGSNHHARTEALGHGGGVEQGAGGGRVAIVCHRRQQEALGQPGAHEEELTGAAPEGNALPLPEEVGEHLGSHCGRVADVSEGQVAEEKVHRRVQTAVTSGQKDEGQVPGQGHQVDAQEGHKAEGLQLWVVGKPQEDEHGH